MSKTHNNDLPLHLRCMTSQTRADYEGTKRPDIKLVRIHDASHLSKRRLKPKDYECTKEPRTREGQTYPGGKQMRKRLAHLALRQKFFVEFKPNLKKTKCTRPGSMRLNVQA